MSIGATTSPCQRDRVSTRVHPRKLDLMNTTLVFWDTETTGLDKAFHVPVEFGAVVTDASLRPIDNINISCRPPRFMLPEPGALLTTRAINRRPAAPAANGLQRDVPVRAQG